MSALIRISYSVQGTGGGISKQRLEALHKMKCGLELHEVPTKYPKHTGKSRFPFLDKYVNKLIYEQHFPVIWGHSYKKGDINTLVNNRAVSLLSVISKAFNTQ